MKQNEKKTSDQDVELNLDDVGDKVVGGAELQIKNIYKQYGDTVIVDTAGKARAKLIIDYLQRETSAIPQ